MLEDRAYLCSRANSGLDETQRRKRKVTDEQIHKADAILQDCDLQLEGKRLTSEQLGTEVGAEVDGRTMYRILQAALDYEKCLACVKRWLGEKPMERPMEYARTMLTKYPEPEDWDRVRFGEEVYFGYGPEGQLHIIRQPGTCYR